MSAKKEGAVIMQSAGILVDAYLDVLGADVLGHLRCNWRRRVSAVKRESCRQSDLQVILLRPGITEVDRVTTVGGREDGRSSALKERGLDEEALAGSLRVTRYPDVIRISERLGGILHILDLNIRDLGRGHLYLDHVAQGIFALCRRVVVVVFLLGRADMSGVLNLRVAFQRAVLAQL